MYSTNVLVCTRTRSAGVGHRQKDPAEGFPVPFGKLEMDEPTTSARPYAFPPFYRYPPYFTVQPVAETFNKQKDLWSSLILSYCT